MNLFGRRVRITNGVSNIDKSASLTLVDFYPSANEGIFALLVDQYGNFHTVGSWNIQIINSRNAGATDEN